MNKLLVYWTGSVVVSFVIFLLSSCKVHRAKHAFNDCMTLGGVFGGQLFLILWLLGLVYIFYT
jgi:hypothetical protein